MRLIHIRKITATIKLRSGLHIGAGKDTVEIGGLDQPIIKDPLSGAPYIPGSSLKGKMRSLLETGVFMAKNEATRKAVMAGKPCGCGKRACPVCTIFGAHNSKSDEDLGPTRLLVRDSYLTDEFAQKFNRGQLPMEVKNENTINRLTGKADNPRPLERVPANVAFEMNLALKVFEGDPEKLEDWIFKGLALIQMDALGGNSSRGCGQVVFDSLKLDGEAVDLSDYETL